MASTKRSALFLGPLDRVRKFLESTRGKYRDDGCLGCMLGGFGQELSGVSPVFQEKIEACLSNIAGRIADCMEQAQTRGDLRPDADLRPRRRQLLAALAQMRRRDPAAPRQEPASRPGDRMPHSATLSQAQDQGQQPSYHRLHSLSKSATA